MSSKQELLASLRSSGVVAVIRTETPRDLVGVAKALAAGGVRFVEITLTVPGAIEIIREAAAALKGTDVAIGAGTVLDGASARAAIMAGARFIVSPGLDVETVKVCALYGTVVMPGAFTPNEIIAAWKAGADVVKIFPADIGGPEYLKTVKEPLPQVELLPTKGIDFETAGAYLKAGAIAVGVGGALVNKALIAAGDYGRITANAERFVRLVREVRPGATP
jgi:2-dehydro-3-deoxyphosphogluconate aldolase/(4S)-4-hydroxy-2-oxoglutarate aldolase